MICVECGQARRIGDRLQVFILGRCQVAGENRVITFHQLFRQEVTETFGQEKGSGWNAGLAREGLAPSIHPMSHQWTIGSLSDAEFHRVRLLTSSLSSVAFRSVSVFRSPKVMVW